MQLKSGQERPVDFPEMQLCVAKPERTTAMLAWLEILLSEDHQVKG